MRDFAPEVAAGVLPPIRTLAEPLLHAVQVLAALDAVLAPDALCDPVYAGAARELTVAADLAEAADRAGPAEARRMRAAIRAELLLALRPGAGTLLGAELPALNAALGEISAGLPAVLARAVIPHLDGLQVRLEGRGARLLDIGTGIGAVAIGMARLWPHLAVTGIEPLAAIAEEARLRVAAAGLSHRVEIHTLAGEDLSERAAYDLAFVPSAFIAPERLGAVIERAVEALRPGGWLLLAAGTDSDPAARVLWRFRAASCGGTGLGRAEAAETLRAHGLTGVSFHPFGPDATVGVVAGCRGQGS